MFSKSKKNLIILVLLLMLLPITLISCKEVEKCTIIFEVEGAVYYSATSKINESIILPPEPLKDGYIFDGWYFDKDVWNEEISTNYSWDIILNHDMTVYAKFIEVVRTDTYKVSFRDYDSKILKEENIIYSNSAVAPAVPIREGHTFIGWDRDFSEIKTDLVVKAVYTVNQYTIEFVSNGGTDINPVTANYNTSISAPSVPIREGFVFVNWYEDNGIFEQIFNFDKMPAREVKLYAYWVPFSDKDNVEFVSLGEVTKEENNLYAHVRNSKTIFSVLDNLKVKDNTKINVYSDIEGINEIVTGVLDLAIGENIVYVLITSESGIVKRLYVLNVYRNNVFQVTFDINDNSENYLVNVEEGFLVNSYVPNERNGFTFLNWKNGDKIWDFETDIVNDNLTLLAYWELIEYSINYNLNGGENNQSNPQIYTTIDEVLFETPIRLGYDFQGWFEDLDFSTQIDKISFGSTGIITVHAKWAIIEYSITYELSGGENVQSNPEYYTVENEFFFTEPIKDGYNFDGWFEDLGFSTQIYKISLGSSGDITIYARWSPKSYNVSFESNGGNSISNKEIFFDSKFALKVPLRENYVFLSWNTEDGIELTDEKGFSIISWSFLEDLKLYANWRSVEVGDLWDANKLTVEIIWEEYIEDFYGGSVDTNFSLYTGQKFLADFGHNYSLGFNLKNTVLVFDDAPIALECANESEVYSLIDSLNLFFKDNHYLVINYSRYKDTNIIIGNFLSINIIFMGDSIENDGVWFSANEEMIIRSNSSKENYEIPISVKTVNMFAFAGNIALKSVVVPSSVENIMHYSFFNCNNLEEIFFKENSQLLIIEEEAFAWNENLSSINFPENFSYVAPNIVWETAWYNNQNDGIVYIGDVAYGYKGNMPLNTTLKIKKGTKTITDGAFYGQNNLVAIEIPASVIAIGEYVFDECLNLKSISVKSGNTLYKSIDGVLFSGDERELIMYPSGRLDNNYIIPEKVYTIKNKAFSDNPNLHSVSIPSSIIDIGSLNFYSCINLESIQVSEQNEFYQSDDGVLYSASKNKIIVYPKGKTDTEYYILNTVESLDDAVFRENGYLRSVEIPSSVTNIGKESFFSCANLEEVIFEEDSQLASIGSYAFYYCEKLINISFPASLISIGEGAFNSCYDLEEVSFAQGSMLSNIGNLAFAYCQSLVSVIIPISVSEIGYGAFEHCRNLVDVCFEEGCLVTSIERRTFAYCESLTSIEIPSSIMYIWNNAFEFCSNLEDIDFGVSSQLISIGDYVFYNCESLREIIISSNVSTIGSYVFKGCSNLETVSIEEGNMTYKLEDGVLMSFDGKDILVYPKSKTDPNYSIPEGVESIKSGVFAGNENLETIIIPSSVASIEKEAFENCSELKSIVFDAMSQLINIGEHAFFGCVNLGVITIPESVTSVASSAFWGCSNLVSINVDEKNISYKSIDGVLMSFDGKEIIVYPNGKTNSHYDIPEGVEILRDRAFSGNTHLTSITFSDSVSEIGIEAFQQCANLENIYFKEASQLTKIGSQAFYSCLSLISITIPASVIDIGDGAFGYCSNLESVYFAANSQLSNMANGLFSLCQNLSSIVIPNSVLSIGSSVFQSCANLIEIYYAGISAENWELIEIGEFNDSLISAEKYYYSEEPIYDDEHWHYISGVPVIWKS